MLKLYCPLLYLRYTWPPSSALWPSVMLLRMQATAASYISHQYLLHLQWHCAVLTKKQKTPNYLKTFSVYRNVLSCHYISPFIHFYLPSICNQNMLFWVCSSIFSYVTFNLTHLFMNLQWHSVTLMCTTFMERLAAKNKKYLKSWLVKLPMKWVYQASSLVYFLQEEPLNNVSGSVGPRGSGMDM